MKKIIIGCPYGGLKGLKKALSKKLGKEDYLADVKDISAIDFENVYIGKKFKKHPIKSFTSSFIRYPYDLISPHTGTYEKREYTEFFKTVALLFKDKSINEIDKNFNSRNRLYSLKIAESYGLKVPKSILVNKKKYDLEHFGKQIITKSVGNCFYALNLPGKPSPIKKRILSYEKDHDEKAYVYLPHKIKHQKDLNLHIDSFGTVMLQNCLLGDEYRVYIIGNKIFSYKRGENPRLDKSFSSLLDVHYKFTKSEIQKLKQLKRKLKLNFLCLDVIIIKKDAYVIDINPFGSLPEYHLHPEPTDELSKLILL